VVTVEVWWAIPAAVRPRDAGVLGEAELLRLASIRRPGDQARFVTAAALLRQVAGSRTGVPPARVAVERSCGRCPRAHGRPRLPGTGLHASISHSAGLVAVAVTSAGPVGIDVERVGDRDHAGAAERVLGHEDHAGEPAGFYRYWTRKESAVKATGDGLAASLAAVRVSAPGEPARLLEYPGRAGLDAVMSDLRPGDGYAAAVTVLARGPLVVREHPPGSRVV
jgi:4'-phosphopantetheinyl transferase